MGFSDRLRAWLKGESKRAAASPQMREGSKEAAAELEQFARSRVGVEAFLEPKTTLYSTTVLLIADDGEYLRRPVTDRAQAASLCGELNIPLYDARKVGYPQRMRDYDQGRAPRRVELSDLPPWPGEEPPQDGPPPPPIPPSEDPADAHPHLPGAQHPPAGEGETTGGAADPTAPGGPGEPGESGDPGESGESGDPGEPGESGESGDPEEGR